MTATLSPSLVFDEPGSAATIRHDLITPVYHVLGFADLLIDDARAKGRPFRVYSLGSIRTTAQEATRAIDQILTLADPSAVPDMTALGRALLVPARSIVEACGAIEEASGPSADRLGFLEDLGRIRNAANRLVSLALDFAAYR